MGLSCDYNWNKWNSTISSSHPVLISPLTECWECRVDIDIPSSGMYWPTVSTCWSKRASDLYLLESMKLKPYNTCLHKKFSMKIWSHVCHENELNTIIKFKANSPIDLLKGIQRRPLTEKKKEKEKRRLNRSYKNKLCALDNETN